MKKRFQILAFIILCLFNFEGAFCQIDSINSRSTEKKLNKKIDTLLLVNNYYKKADSLKTIDKIKAREYCLKALKIKPNFGKAYLMIARLYAISASSCGNDEFSKRMVFVAAANKAKMAKKVQPSITSTANKYIKAYMYNTPLNLKYYSGDTFEIKCWINETIIIP